LALLRQDKIYENSIWEWHEGKIIPQRYTYTQEGSRKNRNIDIRFDWQANIAHSLYRGERYELPLHAGILDHSVYQIQLMYDLAQQPQVQHLNYTIINGKNIKPYTLNFEGEERLDTALGTLNTLKFSRIDTEDNRRSFLWLSPALHYLPVRAQHTEPKGETVVMQIDSVTGIHLSSSK
jgi:hypothetical protein